MRAHEDSAEADEAGIRLHFAGITRVIFWENRLFLAVFAGRRENVESTGGDRGLKRAGNDPRGSVRRVLVRAHEGWLRAG